MKKLLDSDLLRAVQFNRNTSANYTGSHVTLWLKRKMLTLLRSTQLSMFKPRDNLLV